MIQPGATRHIYIYIVPVTLETEAGEALEVMGSRPAWATNGDHVLKERERERERERGRGREGGREEERKEGRKERTDSVAFSRLTRLCKHHLHIV
jgi:hypothetical protein